MTKVLIGMVFFIMLAVPAEAVELSAPEVPMSAWERMPQNTDSFGAGCRELLHNSILLVQPELKAAMEVSVGILFAVVLFSLLPMVTEKSNMLVSIAGAAVLASEMLQCTNSMIGYASDAVWEICEYGKLLCPVMTTALAAQGGITASAALYTGTIAFITCLSTLVSRVFIPMLYVFLVFSISHCALGEGFLKTFADTLKNTLSWLLKTILIIFTSYMSISGVVSGTADTAVLKAAKATISSVVPVVGGILSDASESVLVSMGVMKNAAGIYGILAALAVFIGPFIKVGVQYLFLKMTAAICSVFGNKRIVALVGDFSAAMGLLLAMVASGCVMVLVSTVCFMKGIGG